MGDEFSERLKAAREAGLERAKRRGQSVKALTFQALDRGEADPIAILVEVLEARGQLPDWLADQEWSEVNAVLTVWGTMRQAMRDYRKAMRTRTVDRREHE